MGSRTTVEDGDAEAADSGPLRLCAVSRVQKPPEELIRFVAGPDGKIVPDLARRLPGRGVWVDATREAVAEAVSLANKAGLLVAGFAKVEELIEGGEAVALIHAADAAADGVGKLDRTFKALRGPNDTPAAIVRELAGAELSLAMGRPNVIHAAAAEGGASLRLIEEARRLGRYRLGSAPAGCPLPDNITTQDVHD